MDPIEIQRHLKSIFGENESPGNAYEFISDLEASEPSIEAVSQILQFMEANPKTDFGSPGVLVHFMESFYRRGYEEQLEASLARRPTAHTVWMLNRMINGQQDQNERVRLLKLLAKIRENRLADAYTRSSAQSFLDFQNG